jgi:hypothetical protein
MDKKSQELFDSIVAKAPHELIPTEIEFLKARTSYLTEAQAEKFSEALGIKKKPGKKSDAE